MDRDPFCILSFLFLLLFVNFSHCCDVDIAGVREGGKQREKERKWWKTWAMLQSAGEIKGLIRPTTFLPFLLLSFPFSFLLIPPIISTALTLPPSPPSTPLSLSISVNRTSKASELDGEWQCLLLVCRQTCLLQSVSLKASAKCLSRLKAIVLLSSPLRSQTSPLFLSPSPLSQSTFVLWWSIFLLCVCVCGGGGR